MSGSRLATPAPPKSSRDSVDAIFAELVDIGDEAERGYAAVFERVSAGSSLLEALDLPPQTVDVLYAQAFARFEAHRIAEAIHLFHALTLLAPKVKDHWLGLGISMRTADQFDAARVALDIAFTLAPDCPAVLLQRTELGCLQQDWSSVYAEIDRFEALSESALKDRLAPEFHRYAELVRSRS